MDTKTCIKCNIEKEINKENFRLRQNGHYENVCKVCSGAAAKITTAAWCKRNPEKVKQYAKDRWLNSTPEQKENNLKSIKLWLQKHPWFAAWKRSITRCKYDTQSSYYKRGIEHTATVEDFKEAWIRDGAENMLQPSINRKNPDFGYHRENIEYMELQDNLEGKKSTRFNSHHDW